MITSFKNFVKSLYIYFFDFINDCRYTTLLHGNRQSMESLCSSLIENSHTIEKGLTMPEKRSNFGIPKIRKILDDLFYCIDNFGTNDERVTEVVSILFEYESWHVNGENKKVDSSLSSDFKTLHELFPDVTNQEQLYNITSAELFSKVHSDFYDFSNSRHSCRNLKGDVDHQKLNQALELAQNAPSTCNRQATRIHVICDTRTIMNIQSGNRGFGHLVKTCLLVTSSLSYWPGGRLRNAPYVDGGIFVMNLLYSLHYYGIAACTLNMYLDKRQTQELQNKLSIPKNEVPVALISVGAPPEKFDLARSSRRSYNNTVFYHTI